MLTPDGYSAQNIEKVMLLALWGRTLEKQRPTGKKVILAGLGRPTYPINSNTINSYLSYWQKLADAAEKWHLDPEGMFDNVAIDYGDPKGDIEPRTIMASVMSKWYESEIKPEQILFTVGGIGGLRAIFDTFNTHFEDTPGYRIITPFPHYSVYSSNSHQLHPIDVMKTPGYKLKANVMEDSIKEAYRLAQRDQGLPKAVLFCNPSNPLGTLIGDEELYKIADVLRKYPDLYIIFDEAYAEMSFYPMLSFLKIAPDLKHRTIILRSATKALSAAGERMAVLLVFDEELMNELLNKNINNFLHAPRSAQLAYAQTMETFDKNEQRRLTDFYQKKVTYVANRLQDMGAEMPDPIYEVEATFYVLGDFSDLFGLKLPEEASRALQKTGKVNTDEELAYYLLFEDGLMITPLSYLGLSEKDGYFRITCSAHESELKELMDRLEHRLIQARNTKKEALLKNIHTMFAEMAELDVHTYRTLVGQVKQFTDEETDCLTLKNQVYSLEKIMMRIREFFVVTED